MRHLSTEELLLYAEGELEAHELCQHVADCVDCKARMVDLQETYVHAATELLAQAPPAPPVQLQQFRIRLAAEAQLLETHLTTEDLLLSVDDSLSPDSRAHLNACTGCRDRAADIHVQLAEIEYELHRQTAFELPADRRAAALAALRVRLQREVKRQKARAVGPWAWVRHFRLPQVPAFASYATAFASAVLVAWATWSTVLTPDLPAPERAAAVPAPETVTNAPVAATAGGESAAVSPPERFELAEHRSAPAPTVALEASSAPALALGAAPALPVPINLPSAADLPAALPVRGAATFALPLPGRIAPLRPDSSESVIAGSWMLASSGLWKESLQAGGRDGRIRFTGSVANEHDRRRIEEELRIAANGHPVEFAISVRASRVQAPATTVLAAAASERPAGGMVRNSLLQHYEDAARRSFQPLETSRLENEINRYVTGVMRNDAELLAHVHALHTVLNRAGIDAVRSSEDFRRVTRFHLDAIAKHEAVVYSQLSEVLPRNYWKYRDAKGKTEAPTSLGLASRELLKDALALDRALTTMFFETSEPLDAREATPSVGSLLARVHQRARQLRAALK